MSTRRSAHGMTLVEVMIALAIGSLLIAALSSAVGQSLSARSAIRERSDLTQQARFAMDRMVAAVSGTTRLLIPLPENAATGYSESIRDVLAVALDPTLDRDGDGFADADNDKDGRVDEDLGADASNDNKAGVVGIDDDNDGAIDEGSNFRDDDEDGAPDEDTGNAGDDDGDGATDEDGAADMNGDGKPGVAGVDDDGDGSIDESNPSDDDEDSANDEDWIDPVVYFLNGTTLMERLPNIDPADGSDYTERAIAENVSQLRVERLAAGPNDRAELVDITLGLTRASGETLSLNARVRAGGTR